MATQTGRDLATFMKAKIESQKNFNPNKHHLKFCAAKDEHNIIIIVNYHSNINMSI